MFQRKKILTWMKQNLMWGKTKQILVTAQINLCLSAVINLTNGENDPLQVNDKSSHDVSLAVVILYSLLPLVTCFIICKYWNWDEEIEEEVEQSMMSVTI